MKNQGSNFAVVLGCLALAGEQYWLGFWLIIIGCVIRDYT